MHPVRPAHAVPPGSAPRPRRPARWLAVLTALATVCAAGWVAVTAPVAASPAAAEHDAETTQWTVGGHDYRNTRANPTERALGSSTVHRLATGWTATTHGDVSATPAVVDGAVYFPDWGGYFSKLDARSGRVIWSRRVADYVGIDGAVSRSSPAVAGRTVYIGTQLGARLLAIDTATGDLRWSVQAEAHPQAILTQSPVVYQGVVYQGVSSTEEIAAADPAYPCCTFRGSLLAVDAASGRIRWKRYLLPDQGGSTDIFSGAPVWSGTPAIDPASNTVYVTTGNNYAVPQSAEDCQSAGGTAEQCLPPWNVIDSIVALDLRTGAIKWATGGPRFDTWNGGCLPGNPPNNCPIAGPDADFGDGAHLFTVPGAGGRPRTVVGAGQKSGTYWAVDAVTGQILWSAAVGPGSSLGGIQWGTATDGRRVYFAENNLDQAPYQLPGGQTITSASFGALDPATGRILWQVAEPHGGQAQAAVSTANGVVYAGGLNGHMYALDGATGRVLWDTVGEGSSNAGPAIVDGTVYWGNGYGRYGIGTPSTTFYAFSLPRGGR